MKKAIPPFGLRLPDDLKSWVESQAARNERSQNAEIVVALKEKRERQENEKSGTTA